MKWVLWVLMSMCVASISYTFEQSEYCITIIAEATCDTPMKIRWKESIYRVYNDRNNKIRCGILLEDKNPQNRFQTPTIVLEALGITLTDKQREKREHGPHTCCIIQ